MRNYFRVGSKQFVFFDDAKERDVSEAFGQAHMIAKGNENVALFAPVCFEGAWHKTLVGWTDDGTNEYMARRREYVEGAADRRAFGR